MHYTITVVTKTNDQAELAAAMAPFMEAGTGECEPQYIQFVDDHESAMAEYNEVKTMYQSPEGVNYGTYDERFYRKPTALEHAKIKGTVGTFGSVGDISYHKTYNPDTGCREFRIRMTADEVVSTMDYKVVQEPMSTRFANLKEFCEEYGWDMHEGRLGLFDNPNGYWDWWVVGGRWAGLLTDKDGNEVDSGYIHDLDLSGQRDAEEAAETWEKAQTIIAGRVLVPSEGFKEDSGTEYAGKNAYDQPVLKELRNANLCGYHKPERLWQTKEEYVEGARKRANMTFAFLGLDGVWHMRERYDGEKWQTEPDWETTFAGLYSQVSEDSYVWIVDYHS